MRNGTDPDTATPHEIMAAIERDARALDAGGRQLAKAITSMVQLELQYQQALQEALITIVDDVKQSGGRMPAEDVRKALAHRQVPSGIYAAYLTKRAEIDALKAWTRTVESTLSSRQSLLAVAKWELNSGL